MSKVKTEVCICYDKNCIIEANSLLCLFHHRFSILDNQYRTLHFLERNSWKLPRFHIEETFSSGRECDEPKMGIETEMADKISEELDVILNSEVIPCSMRGILL